MIEEINCQNFNIEGFGLTFSNTTPSDQLHKFIHRETKYTY